MFFQDIFLIKSSECWIISRNFNNTIGEPNIQIITNWVTTKGTTLGQRGATGDMSTRTEVYIGSTLTEFPN